MSPLSLASVSTADRSPFEQGVLDEIRPIGIGLPVDVVDDEVALWMLDERRVAVDFLQGELRIGGLRDCHRLVDARTNHAA